MGRKEIEGLLKEGLNSRYAGDFEKALKKCRDVLSLIGNDTNWLQKKTAETWHQMGVTCQNMGDYPMAFAFLLDALNLRMALDDLAGIAYTFFQIQMCRLARGDDPQKILWQQAKEAIENAIPGLKKAGDTKTLEDMHRNLDFIDFITQ